MDPVIDNDVDELDVQEHTAEAALQAIKDTRAKLRKEAEEKRQAAEAEAKKKAEEAERKKKAEEAKRKEAEAKEAERVAKEAAEKKKAEAEKAEANEKAKAEADRIEAERVEKARTAQAFYEQGVRNVHADQRNLAEQTARINAQALATKRRNLGKLRVGPNDLLMQVPIGPVPSNAKVQNIHRGLVHQPKKRKLLDEDDSVILADTTKYEAGISVSFVFISVRFG
jgi:hypothetical protein